MRKIVKGPEPSALLEYRKGKKPGVPDPDYQGFREMDALRESIVKEQRGLCCYCMGRIHAHGMKVEHCLSQEMHPDEQLNYRNLLGACKGGEGQPARLQHCDTRKGRQSLSFNPADPHFDIESSINYLGNGEIFSINAEINRELGEAVLNLNLPMLKSNRKAALDGFQSRLRSGEKLNAAKELAKWDGSRSKELPEYAAVVACYLRKKLR